MKQKLEQVRRLQHNKDYKYISKKKKRQTVYEILGHEYGNSYVVQCEENNEK